MITEQSIDTHASTNYSNTEGRRVVQCARCLRVMEGHFKRHVMKSKGLCDGAKHHYFTQYPDGTLEPLTVKKRMPRKSGTEDDDEKRRLYEEIAALKRHIAATEIGKTFTDR